MQRSGTEAIRTQIQLSKPEREITNITNSQNTKRTYGQPSEKLFLKRWPLSNRNRTKTDRNTRKVKRHQNSDTKTGNKEPQKTTALERSVMNYWGLKLALRVQPHPKFLKWYKIFIIISGRRALIFRICLQRPLKALIAPIEHTYV